jgi:hypothetical protein
MRHRIAAMSFVLVILIAGGVTIVLARSPSATAHRRVGARPQPSYC